jgi:hypothetical protein
VINNELIRGQEGHTGVVELEPASQDDEAVAEDDPEAVRLMIDFFYLGDYDPDVITKHSSTSSANEIDSALGTSRSPQQEAVKCDTVTEMAMEPRDDTEPGLQILNADPAADQPDFQALPVKKKKKKGKVRLSNDDCSVIRDSKSLRTKNLLTTHAKMYSIAAKYNIRPLMDVAVMKFKSAANDRWDVHDLIAAVPVVYNQTVGYEEEIRDILEVMILEHSYRLVHETGFKEALEHVDGLTFSLFKRLGALSRHQKVCRCCGAAFMSTCALEGCRPRLFGDYSHDCDLKGPCRECRRGEQLL